MIRQAIDAIVNQGRVRHRGLKAAACYHTPSMPQASACGLSPSNLRDAET